MDPQTERTIEIDGESTVISNEKDSNDSQQPIEDPTREDDDMMKQETALPKATEAEPVKNDNANVNNTDEQTEDDDSSLQMICKRLLKFYNDNDFVVMIVIAILLARAYPPLGAEYLQPQITSTWVAVVFIFVLAGLGLKTEEFSKALQRFKFNLFVQVFNLGIVSAIVFGISRGLVRAGALDQSLADGMVVCASLPLTINMVLVLTKSSGGDEASAIFNAAFGNMLGVFVSPVLILAYLGVSGDIELWEVFYKLALRVVAPVAFGQFLQKCCPPIVAFFKKNKPRIKKAQQLSLVFIVYTVFCRTFAKDNESKVSDIFAMIGVQFCLLCSLMTLAWYSLKMSFPNEPTLRVMGLYGCTHKTVAMGVPLINAIYEDNPLVGLYTLPLLIWHPMQLVIGSYLAPKLFQWVQDEKIRLGIEGDDDDNNDDVNTAKVNTKEDKQLNGMGQSMTNQTEKTVGETQKEEVVVNV